MTAYFMPTALDEALALLQGGGAGVVAGGTDFYPTQGRRPVAGDLVDLTRIEGLRGISQTPDGGWHIGATTTWTDVLHADLPPVFDGLRAAAREVGSVQIQNAGTVAGNLCNASPAADGVPPLLTLDAQVEIAGSAGRRLLPLPAFLTSVRQTALQPGEIVTGVVIPPQPDGALSGFGKLGARRYLVISIAMTAVVLGLESDGRINLVRVAVGACSAVAKRLTALETDLIGSTPEDVVVTPEHLASLAPITDMRADAAYRLEAVSEQVARLIRQVAHG